MSSALPCLTFIIVPNFGDWIHSASIIYNIDWYKSLQHSSLALPVWAFGPVWTLMYIFMGFASYLIWEREREKAWIPFSAYVVQLALNWVWPWLFFSLHNVLLSLIGIIALDIAVITCFITFAFVRLASGALLLPYLVWLAFLTHFTFSVYMSN